MRVKTTIVGCVAALLAVLVAASLGLAAAPAQAADTARQPVAVHLTFDRPLDASMAPFVLAQSHGMFAGEGLGVTTDVAPGSAEAIARVASGDSEVALVDINELIRFRDKPGTRPRDKSCFRVYRQGLFRRVTARLAAVPVRRTGISKAQGHGQPPFAPAQT